MTPEELELAETEDLLNELARRFDGMIFAALIDREDNPNSPQERRFYYTGGLMNAVGMARWMESRMLSDDREFNHPSEQG